VRLYIDLDSKSLVTSAGERQAVTELTFKRGDSSVVDCYFVQGGIVQELAVGATGKFGLKSIGDYGGDFIVSDLTWTKVGTGTSTYYRFEPSFNTVDLNALLVDGTVGEYVASQAARYALTGKSLGYIVGQSDDTTFWVVINAAQLANSAGWAVADQIDSISLIAEIEWIEGSAVSSIGAVTSTIPNDVIKGAEGVPTAGTPAYPIAAQVPIWLVSLTALTGGTAACLDSLVTATGLFTSRIVIISISGAAKIYQLVAGTDAESSPTVIRPDDYNASTNAFVWKLAN
jgi:hypothetical protein